MWFLFWLFAIAGERVLFFAAAGDPDPGPARRGHAKF